MYSIGYCITSHGYGHAARAAAVMEAVAGLIDVRWTLAGNIPEWFFRPSITGPYTVHSVQTDIGLVQRNALEFDLPATLTALESFYAGEERILQQLVEVFADCRLIICDISPIGLAAARRIGVPSLLIENFTWDWIYEEYFETCPQLRPIAEHIHELYDMAQYHIQTEPLCAGGSCDLRSAPIARKRKSSRRKIRHKLNVENDCRLVLISMGGEGIHRLPKIIPTTTSLMTVFVVTGLKSPVAEQKNLRVLPENSEFYHPDLVGACDAVIGKVGYSTLAEIYHAGVPFVYITRPDFRESKVLAEFIRQTMRGIEISTEEFHSGAWSARLPALFAAGIDGSERTNGADQCAEFITSLPHVFTEVLHD